MKNPRRAALCAASLACALITGPAIAQNSGPSSNVAWTAATLNLVQSGDPTRGAALNTALECATCHGDTGRSMNDTWPSIAGQPAGYTFKVLKDYQDQNLSGTRRGQLMAYVVAEMSDQDIADIASYYAQNDLPLARAGSEYPEAETLDMLGAPERLIPPCSVCHGNKAQGDFPDFPALAGQSPEFLIRSMMDFKSEQRSNDVYSRMRLIAQQLTDEEIEALAMYFAGLGSVSAQE